MPAPSSFDYAVLRVVPRVDREEFFNAGVVLFCRTRSFLAARVALDRGRLAALDPECDPEEIQRYLELIPVICEGNPSGGPIAKLSMPERFHWLVAPRSTVIQVSPVHTGLTDNPGTTIEHLLDTMVRTGGPASP